MLFPFAVRRDLDKRLIDNFHTRFAGQRAVRSNCWRRHQVEENKELSLWGVDGKHRRRLVYFKDEYALKGNTFVLDKSLIYVHYKAPADEIRSFMDITQDLNEIWKNVPNQPSNCYRLDDLWCEVHLSQKHMFEDEYTPGWWNLDFWFYSDGNDEFDWELPWRIFKKGIRKVAKPGNPTYDTDINKYFPAQVMLGCGPSIEAGIPPLNALHKIYHLSEDGKFMLHPHKDTFLLDMLYEPEKKYREMTEIHKACLEAEVTPFYRKLQLLHHQGKIVGPIITNNFDGLCLSAGLQELYMRQYDDVGEYPQIDFHPDAKTLLVIGSHADRRGVEASARNRRLKFKNLDAGGETVVDAPLQIVYLDPCGYQQGDTFVPYPIESPQDGDVIIRKPASALLDLVKV